jgi:MFS transporter, PAT family, beta-lactamase induction signal transducer AmpG
LSLLGLAWSLKLLWAPLVDRFGQRYVWVFFSQLAIALLVATLAFFDPVGEKTWFWLVLAGICLASATQDIAIDAYTIDILDEKELGPANGVRSAAYRVALITAGGALVILSDRQGWDFTFLFTSATMATLALLVLTLSPFHQKRPVLFHHPRLWNQYVEPIGKLLRKPNFGIVVLFILTFKVGEAMLVAMANPFWIDRGFTASQIGFVVGTLGTLASIGGALAGGSLTARWGIIKSLWILGAIQATAGLGYTLSSLPYAPVYSIYGAALLESLAIGLATSAFLSFLMQLCDKKFGATHYAFLSTLFGFGRSLAGVLSGYSAAWMGYLVFFTSTFIVGLIPLLLIPWLRPSLSPVSKEPKDP